MKNLVYYCLGLKDEYFSIFEKSIKSIDYSNPEVLDVLVITNKSFFDENLSKFNRKNTYYYFVDEFKNGDDVCFSKLKVFDWDGINNYENLLMIDCDVLINTNLSEIFKKCEDKNKLYAPIEDESFENHRRIYFSLGNYTDEDIQFFRDNDIHTFNCGTYMLKNSTEMRNHFSTVNRMIKGYKGDYFSDQSFMNYYFNKSKLVDYNVIDSKKNLVYAVQENIDSIEDTTGKIFHFIGNTYSGLYKIDVMENVYNKIVSKNNINFLGTSEDKKTLFFESKIDTTLEIEVSVKEMVIYREKLRMNKGVRYWVSLNDGFNNKKVKLRNNEITSSFDVHGMEKVYENEVKNINIFNVEDLKKEEKDISHFTTYYFEMLELEKYKELKILDLNTNKIFLKKMCAFFLNSNIVATMNNLDEIQKKEFNNLYYFDNISDVLLDPIIEIHKNESFDIVFAKNKSIFFTKGIVSKILGLLKIGGVLFVEDIDLWSLYKNRTMFESKSTNFTYNLKKMSYKDNHDNKLLLEIIRIK